MGRVNEVIYLGRDNSVDLLLKADGVAEDLSTTTQIDAIFDTSITVESTNAATGPIKWNQAGYETGEIRIDLTDSDESDITVGQYTVKIITYTAEHTDGLYWGEVNIRVREV